MKLRVFLLYGNFLIENHLFFIRNIPFGVFFDIISSENQKFPLELKLHFSDFPVEKLVNKRNFSEKEHYFWDLKQSSCIKFENDAANILMSLPAKKYDLLWDFYQNSKSFWTFFKET